MKKTNGRSRTDPHNSGTKQKLTREATRKEASNIVNNHHITWHDAQTGMMLVRFNEAWHGKVHKQHYKLSGAQYATSCILTKHHMTHYFSLGYVHISIKC